MTWNYRVMRHADGSIAMHEVYYDDNGKPEHWSKEPTTFIGDGDDALEQLICGLETAAKDARQRPILDYTTGQEEPASAEQEKHAGQ